MVNNLKLHVISHTHWDREWYLSFEQFRMRLVDLMDNLIDVIENDPDFRHFHLDGQTIVLEDYLEIRPERRAVLKKLIRRGRILVGPWYLQNDEFLTSGEATVRNLLRGRKIAVRFGGAMPVGYLPDQFGNISQMPQILNGFGIKSAVFGRGYDIKEHGAMEFSWESPDGSSVLAVNLPSWYNNAQRLPEDPEQAAKLIGIVKSRLDTYATVSDYLLMNGVDHLEAQENLSAALRGLKGRLPAGQEVVHGTLPEYFREVFAKLAKRRATDGANGAGLHVKRGELREGDDGQIIAGTLSARVYLKQMNDAAQDEMEKWVEPASVWADWSGVLPYPADYIDYAWRELLKNHPHDSICGCSIDPVHEQMVDRFHRQKEVADGILDRALDKMAKQVDRAGLIGDDQLLVVFNPSQRPRGGLVEATVDFLADHDISGFRLEDAGGREAGFEVLEHSRAGRQVLSPINLPGVINVDRFKVAFVAEEVPPFGYASYTVRALPGNEAKPVAAFVGNGMEAAGGGLVEEIDVDGADGGAAAAALENEFLRVWVRGDGSLDVLDRSTGARFDGVLVFEDGGDVGNAYVYQPPAKNAVLTTKGRRAAAIRVKRGRLSESCEVVHDWLLPASANGDYSGRAQATAPCRITASALLARGSRRLEFKVAVENNVTDHRLRVLVPTGLGVDSAWAGSQFDVIERPANVGERWNRSSNTDANCRFVDASDGYKGLAVLNRGLHEYELLPAGGGTIAMTLLRGVGVIFDRDLRFPRVHELVPGAQALGAHEFAFAIYPHRGGYAEGGVVLEAEEFAVGLKAYAVPANLDEWAHGRPWVQEAAVPGMYERPDPAARLLRLPRHESFITVAGENLVFSALKKAADGKGYVLRAYNAGRAASELRATFARPVVSAWRASLAEEREGALAVGRDGARSVVTAAVGPKEIVTLRVEIDAVRAGA